MERKTIRSGPGQCLLDGMFDLLARPVFSLLSPAGRRARLSILIYHRVLARPDPLLGEPDAVEFRRQMLRVRRHFNFLPLAEAARRLQDGSLPARALCVSFDDGYRDNHDVALPILKALEIPATFFVATGFLDGGRMFNDTVIETLRRLPEGECRPDCLAGEALHLHDLDSRRQALGRVLEAVKYHPIAERLALVAQFASLSPQPLPDDLMMDSAQVRALHEAGMTVGGHTVNHPILTQIDAAEAEGEIRTGKERLEGLIDAPVTVFAYPNGRPGQDYDASHVEIVRRLGFECAVSTHHGVATRDSDPCQLPRFTPWDRSHAKYLARMMLNLKQAGSVLAL